MNFFGTYQNYNCFPPFGHCQCNSSNLVTSISIMSGLMDATYSTGYALGSLFGKKGKAPQVNTTQNQTQFNLGGYYPMQYPMMYNIGGYTPSYMINTPDYLSMFPTFDFSTSKPTSYYLDLLKDASSSQKTGKTDIENVNYDKNGNKLNPFEAFEQMNQVAKDIGYEKSKTHDKKEHGVDMVNQQWHDDANAKKKNVESDYKNLVKDFAKKYIKGIDNKFGNGDGKLTFSEFEKYQLEDLPADADDKTIQAMKESAKIAFNRLNLNGGDTIDEKEMTALLASMDFDTDGNVNGTITVKDFTRVSVKLIDEDKNNLDTILESRYKDFFEENK